MQRVVLGIERLVASYRKLIVSRRIGLVAHPASISSRYIHTSQILTEAGAQIEVIFGPEHGFGGEAQDMEAVDGLAVGPRGVPIVSLYGHKEASLSPSAEILASLDSLVVDLADVGARYYTFVWTALLCLRACHQVGIEMILTDRPNPLGGNCVEGAPQDEQYLSFVGLKPISNRHGLTPAEIVSWAARKEKIDSALTVVPMEGWHRSMLQRDTGLLWVMPSPNMPTFDTALVYPGLCLVEGTWASEGRGTTRPFELIGAPEIDGNRLAARLNAMKLPGVFFRQVAFKPGFQKHAGSCCQGVQVHVVNVDDFLAYRTGVALLVALKAEAGERFKWRMTPYEFETRYPAIDLLSGSAVVRQAVDAGAQLDEVAETWQAGEEAFREDRLEAFLYKG